MAEEERLVGDRTWFTDPRSRFRRMCVSAHPDHGLVVLSLWTGDRCTATFRLPPAEAARLVGTLADGLAAGVQASARASAASPARRGWRGLLDRVRRRSASRRTATLTIVR
jgi:hypothetical protein